MLGDREPFLTHWRRGAVVYLMAILALFLVAVVGAVVEVASLYMTFPAHVAARISTEYAAPIIFAFYFVGAPYVLSRLLKRLGSKS